METPTHCPECYVFGNGNDSALTAALANGGMGGAWNNPIWALAFLGMFANGGWGGWNNGRGGYNDQLATIQNQLNDNQNSTLLMDAIRGNGQAAHELATSLNSDFNAVQTAIQGVQQAIANVAGKNDMNTMQAINAINSGNSMLANQLSSCCCEVKQLVTNFGYENQINNLQQSNMIQKGFGDLQYATQQQTNALEINADANARAIIAKLDSIEDARKDREINALTAELATVKARSEREAELAPIIKALTEVQGKLPSVATVPYPNLVGVPASQFYGFGPYYGGAGQGGGFL